MTKRTLFALLAAGLLLSSCSLFSSNNGGWSGPDIDPTPGNNCTLAILPTPSTGQPALWLVNDFDGSETLSGTYSVQIGSTTTDLMVGGATAQQNDPYTLVITDLTGASPSAVLKDQYGNTQSVVVQSVSVTGSNALDTFSVYVRDTEPVSDNLYLNVMNADKGIRTILKK